MIFKTLHKLAQNLSGTSLLLSPEYQRQCFVCACYELSVYTYYLQCSPIFPGSDLSFTTLKF